MIGSKSHSMAACLLLGLLLLGSCQSLCDAGLIIEVPSSIDTSKISDLAIRRGNLVIRYRDRSKESEIKLPPGALERVALWAASEAKGPLVVSVDSVFVRGGAGVYFPPYIDKDLGDALVGYDAFAASLCIGYYPAQSDVEHPLIRRSGEGSMPHKQFESLMKPSNRSTSAVWYRRLATQYISPPGYPGADGSLAAIGEHTIRALPATDETSGLPVKLEVISHRWIVPHRWYRAIDVPSEWDRWVAALPYEPLRQDMERHWEEYREAFRPLDEVSGIVESYAILWNIRQKDESTWMRFRDRLMQGDDTLRPPPLRADSGYRTLKYQEMPSEDGWIKLAAGTIQPDIVTTAQANLVLEFLTNGMIRKQSRDFYREKVESLANNDPVLRARLALADALVADPKGQFLKDSRRFFEMAKGHPELFRLRAQGIHLLRNRLKTLRFELEKIAKEVERVRGNLEKISKDVEGLRTELENLSKEIDWASFKEFDWTNFKEGTSQVSDQIDLVKDLLDKERSRVLDDFRREVSERLARSLSTKGELAIWEDLSQNVYSDDLIKLAVEDGEGTIDPDLLGYIAEIHYYRGMAPQVGMELAYRHSHFRFLGHLARYEGNNEELRTKIYTYRKRLADLMGLSHWEQEGEGP